MNNNDYNNLNSDTARSSASWEHPAYTHTPVQQPQSFAPEYYYTDRVQKPHKFPEEKKESSSFSKKAVIGLLAGAIVLSSFTGFMGGYLANIQMRSQDTAASPNSSTVLYQSVTGTSSGAEDSYVAASVSQYVLNSVVEITTESVTYNTFMGQYVTEGAGSGVIISSDGYIATNNHVIDGASGITVTLSDGTEYAAELIACDDKTDLAVIKIDAENLSPAVFGTSADLCVGEPVIAIGNPLGELGGTVTSGIISALDRQITIDGQSMTLLQTDASVSPGNSGGGLFNSKGELIGIVNAKSSGDDAEGLGFAIPSDTAKEVIEQLIAFGYVQGRISLGLSLVDINDRSTAAAYRVSTYGVYVLSVTEGSRAEQAGFQSGDRLVSLDGTEFTTSTELVQMLDEYEIGDTVTFIVSRNRQHLNLTLTLEEYTG